MKDQHCPPRLVVFLTAGTNYLSGCQKDKRAFFIVIGATSLAEISAFDLFKKYGVKTIAHPSESPGLGLRQINYTHQRVQGYIFIKSIVLADRIKL